MAKPTKNERYRINNEINAVKVRVVKEDGEQLGVLTLDDALRIARSDRLDLVEIVPQATPPVCKILNYNKFRYAEKKKARDLAKKNREARVEVKELWLRPVTDQHDVEVKIRHAKSFLENGDKVKFTVKFRGREITHTEQGRELLEQIITMLGSDIEVDIPITQAGKQLTLVVTPKLKK